MCRCSVRRLSAVGALALALLATEVGCGAGPVSPLPVQRPDAPSGISPGPPSPPSAGLPSAVGSPASPSTGRPTPARTRRARPSGGARSAASPSPGLPDSCHGQVRYDLDLRNDELALIKSLCFSVGAVLRVQGIGPGEITVDPENLVSRNYEAGVVDIRFVRPGTVSVLIPQNGRTYTITVVVR